MDKLIITVVPDAPPAQLEAFPDLPRTPEQIADEVVRAWNAGAAVTHLHVVDEAGRPTNDPSALKRTVALIRERCDIIIEGSTGSPAGSDPADRCAALQADIDMASLNPGSVNYGPEVHINSARDIDYWVREMHRLRVKPSITAFEAGMIANALPYVSQGLIDTPLGFSFVVGQPGALPATARNVMFLAESLPAGSLWTVAGHGGRDLAAALWAIALGGHARAGFEDSIYYRPGEVAASNAALIDRLVRIAREAERDVATASEARAMLGLRPR